MSCYKQFVFMFYGIISQCRSLRCTCKNLLFLEGKLIYVGIKDLPAVRTLSDANINRKSEVFEHFYYLLLEYYKKELSHGFVCMPINKEANCDKIKRFDATTFTLFSDIFKGAGRNPESGYVNYKVYWQWEEDGVFFVTRLNENASYQVIEEKGLDP